MTLSWSVHGSTLRDYYASLLFNQGMVSMTTGWLPSHTSQKNGPIIRNAQWNHIVNRLFYKILQYHSMLSWRYCYKGSLKLYWCFQFFHEEEYCFHDKVSWWKKFGQIVVNHGINFKMVFIYWSWLILNFFYFLMLIFNSFRRYQLLELFQSLVLFPPRESCM